MQRLSWLISSGLAIFGVMMIQYFYQFESETGSLGVVGLALAIPFVLLCLFITFRYFTDLSRHKATDGLMRGIYMLVGVAFLFALIYFALDFKEVTFAELGGSTTDKDSQVYGLFWLNEHTSAIYFNFYTIAALISLAAITGAVNGVFKPKRKEDTEA